MVGHPLAADERQDDRNRLFEPADAVVERVAECRVLGLVPPGAEPEDQPPVRDLVDRRRHLRRDRGRPEPGAQDDRAKLGTLRRGRDGCEQRRRLVQARLVLVGETEEDVVIQPEAVDAAGLGQLGELLQPRPGARSGPVSVS